MMRRIFFAIPDVPQARRVVDELQANGIGREQIHTWSKSGVQPVGLPLATEAQGADRTWTLDKLLWSADLIVFALATTALVLADVYGSLTWAITALW